MTDQSIKGIRDYTGQLAKQVIDGQYGEYRLDKQYTSDGMLTVELVARTASTPFKDVRLYFLLDKGDAFLTDYAVTGWS